MSVVGTPMALDHSLTHSILINLFIKVGLNLFSPTSPAKYSIVLPQGLRGIRLTGFMGVLERRKFLSNSMACRRWLCSIWKTGGFLRGLKN